MVYSIYSFYDSYSDDGQFGVYAGSSPDNLPEMVPVMLDEIKKIQDGVTPQELARAKSRIYRVAPHGARKGHDAGRTAGAISDRLWQAA